MMYVVLCCRAVSCCEDVFVCMRRWVIKREPTRPHQRVLSKKHQVRGEFRRRIV